MKKHTIIIIAALAAAVTIAQAEPEVRRAIPVNRNTKQQQQQATFTPPAVKTVAAPTPASTPRATTLTPEEEKTAEAIGAFLLFIVGSVLFIMFWLWLLPGIIASKRRHPNAGSIWLVTIFLGWSMFGWIGALIWACGQKD